jgi:hypothetical protein
LSCICVVCAVAELTPSKTARYAKPRSFIMVVLKRSFVCQDTVVGATEERIVYRIDQDSEIM